MDKLITILLGPLAEYGARLKLTGALGLQATGVKYAQDGKFLVV